MPKVSKVDSLVKSHKTAFSVIPAEVPRQARDPELVEWAGIQEYQGILDPGACLRPDPGFAGLTALVIYCQSIILLI
jgi:hypothetical protein